MQSWWYKPYFEQERSVIKLNSEGVALAMSLIKQIPAFGDSFLLIIKDLDNNY